MASADDLFTGGLPAIKFPEVGARHKMTVTRVGEPGVETDMATGAVKTFPSGDPRPRLVVDVTVDEIDPDVEDDDGSRTLYLQGLLLKAVVDAVRAARQKGLRPGGVLEIVHHESKPSATKGFADTKLYKARYTPPAAGSGSDALFDDQPAAKVATQLQRESAAKVAAPDDGPDW
jgi:hypothetical protein